MFLLRPPTTTRFDFGPLKAGGVWPKSRAQQLLSKTAQSLLPRGHRRVELTCGTRRRWSRDVSELWRGTLTASATLASVRLPHHTYLPLGRMTDLPAYGTSRPANVCTSSKATRTACLRSCSTRMGSCLSLVRGTVLSSSGTRRLGSACRLWMGAPCPFPQTGREWCLHAGRRRRVCGT
eukprot:Rmarinus@m.18559